MGERFSRPRRLCTYLHQVSLHQVSTLAGIVSRQGESPDNPRPSVKNVPNAAGGQSPFRDDPAISTAEVVHRDWECQPPRSELDARNQELQMLAAEHDAPTG